MNSNKYKLNATQLRDLEELINKHNIIGLEFGATLNERLIVDFYNGNYQGDVREFLRKIGKYIVTIVRLVSLFGKSSLQKTDILITKQFDREDLNLFIKNTLNILDDVSVSVLFNDEHESGCGGYDINHIPVRRAGFLKFTQIFISMLNCATVVKALVRKRSDLNLHFHHIVFISLEALVQSMRYYKMFNFLGTLFPILIITEYDRGRLSSPLILAAKKKNISSITFVHGALEAFPSYGFSPLISDIACCWGKDHIDGFIQHGESADKLKLIGNHSIYINSLDRNITKKVRKILVATNPISLDLRQKYIETIVKTTSAFDNIDFSLRIHPAESLSFYENILSVSDCFSVSKETKEEAIIAHDIVVVGDSSFAYDAVIAGKLVIALCLPDQELLTIKRLIDENCIYVVNSSTELEQAIRNLSMDVRKRIFLTKMMHSYIKKYIEYSGAEAALLLRQQIDEMVYNDKI